ncbi:hypothetical protein DFH28DRAFT_924710 [Melampsora americana]|nr:hypothetical protein DFH28DRAFT_924710 [Melampsora americana]
MTFERCLKAILGPNYVDLNPTIHGLERFEQSIKPSPVYSRNAMDWIPGLQWTVQDNGNTVQSEFAAYCWHLDIKKHGQTHNVRFIDIWYPDGPMKFVSKLAIINCFSLQIVAATTTLCLYTAVQILLRDFVAYANTFSAPFSHVDLYRTISKSCNTDTEGPKDVIFVEEVLDTP